MTFAALTVSETADTVAEAAGEAEYKVRLAKRPTASVTVTPKSSDTLAATVSGALTFTRENWDTDQAVTVTGVSDDFVGDRTAVVTHTAAGGGYSLTAVDTVTVTVTNDDDAGLVVSETADTVAEAAGEETYKVKLSKGPTANVTVTPKSSDTLAAKASPATLTFTKDNWNEDQTVTVTGVADSGPGDRTVSVSHDAAGGGYTLTAVDTVTVTVTDDDAALTVSATADTVVEAGDTSTYQVRLAVAPTDTVTVTPKSSDVLAATVSGALKFTDQDWNVDKTVTVTGVSDNAVGNRTARVTHDASGGGYSLTGANEVTVSVTDDDAIGLSKTVLVGTDNAWYSYDVTNLSADTVTVTATVSDTRVFVVNGNVLDTGYDCRTASGSNCQVLAVTIAPNANKRVLVFIPLGASGSGTVTHTAPGHPLIPSVSVTVSEVTVSPTALVLSPSGSKTYTISLTTSPTDTVKVKATSPSALVTVTPDSVLLHSANYGSGATITVEAAATGSGFVRISHAATSDDADYDGTGVDTVDVVVSGGSGTTVSRGSLGMKASADSSYTVVLTGPPTADVTVSALSGDSSVAKVRGASGSFTDSAALTFTADNWYRHQTVTVRSISNDQDAQDETTTITHRAKSTDGTYDGITIGSIAVTVDDPHVAALNTPDTVKVTEGGAAARVDLSMRTTAVGDVSLTLTSSDDAVRLASAQGGPYGSSVTLDMGKKRGDWRYAWVKAAEDVDRNDLSAELYWALTSTDGEYNGLKDTVPVLVTDDDADNVILTLSVASLAEGASARQVTVTAGAPSAISTARDVTVAVGKAGDGATEGTDYATVDDLTVTIAANQTSGTGTFTLTPTDDAEVEGDEDVSVTGSGTGLSVEGATLTLTDNDIGLTVSPTSVSEDTTATTVTVTAAVGKAAATARTVAVAVGKTGDGATEGTDYATVADLTVTIAANQTSGTGTFTLTPTDDSDVEGDETISVTGTATGLSVTGTTLTLADDDTWEVKLSVAPTGVGEAAGNTSVTVTARVKSFVAVERVVTVAVGNEGDGAIEGTDYATVNDFTITIPANALFGTGTFTLTPTQDTDVEGDETVSVSGSGTSLTVTGASVTLIDDDFYAVTLAVDETSVGEEESATVVTVTATVAAISTARTVTVAVGAADDGATEGTDYATVDDFTVTVAANQTSGTGTFTLTPTDDANVEGDETISVSGSGTSLAVTGATITLLDDDAALVVSPASVTVAEAGDTATYTVKLAKLPTESVTVTPKSADTLAARVSGALTFTTQDWNTEQTVTVTGVSDQGAGNRTTDVMHAAAGGGYSLTDVDTVTVTVTDDDAGLTTSEAADTVAEAAGKATYTVALAAQPTANVTVTPSELRHPGGDGVGGADLHEERLGHGPDGDGDGGEQRHSGGPYGDRHARRGGGRLLAHRHGSGDGDGGGRRRGRDGVAQHADGGRGGGARRSTG